uniref:Uncharacterized protein n=1 Tax=Anopheles farauti TaxID=69004 RepID=A0A182QWI5_9DIPT
MTMSHLLKQTKKCCAKIIRKLSFNPTSTATGGGGGGGGIDHSPTNNGGGHGLNNRITAKYVLHTNCTPTRCKVQPGDASTIDDGAVDGWMETRMVSSGEGGGGISPSHRRSPSPPPIPETQNNYKLSRSMKNLPKKRTNITSNKNVNLRKCFRLRSKTFDGPLTASDEQREQQHQPQQQHHQLSQSRTHSGLLDGSARGSSPSIGEQGAGERRTTVVPADSLTLASNNSSSRLIGSKLDKISKSLMRSGDRDGEGDGRGGGSGTTALELAKPLFLSASKHRRSNYNHIEPEDDEEGQRTSGYAGEELVLTSGTGTASLGRRGELRFEQETTLSTVSAATGEQDDPALLHTPSVMERLTVAETAAALLFEKVKYDRTKRYLIDQLPGGGGGTPSSSSCCSSPFHLAKSDDFVDPWKNYNIRGGASWDKVSKSPWDSSAKTSPARVAPAAASVLLQTAVQQPAAVLPPYQPMRTHWNPFEYSPAHLARLSSSQPPPPTPPQQQQQYRPAFQVQTDVWENLNSKQYEIDTDVVWRSTRCSSRRTSASTVETWIDDETFDNSFNEELERRCVTLKICE